MAMKKKMSPTAAALSLAGAFAAAIAGGLIANNNSHHTLAEDPTGVVSQADTDTLTEYDAAINEALNEDSASNALNTADPKEELQAVTDETSGLYDDIDLEVTGKTFRFRNDKRLSEHYEKHGIEMGFDSKDAYAEAADRVIHDPESLHKLEKEDSDYVFYLEKTNEFVIVSGDGYIRTYFNPNDGIRYYNRQ